MVEVKFYDNVADEFLKFAVIISKTDNKWVFCKHKERETYEIPGGHREPGESILEASNPVPTPLLGHRCRSSQEITGSPTPLSTSNHYLWICPRASFSLSNPNIAA